MDRSQTLTTAERLVNGDRNKAHGDPWPSLSGIAKLWSVYKGISFSPHDVAAMMILLKISRLRFSPFHDDSWIDICGYAACGAEVVERERALEPPTAEERQAALDAAEEAADRFRAEELSTSLGWTEDE